jgi:hypothetical protein
MLLAVDWQTAGGVHPDTLGYLNFDSLRQPLYGIWANAIHAVAGSWRHVGQMQIALLALALVIFWRALWVCGRYGPWGVLVGAIGIAILLKLGIGSQVPALISEGLFLPVFTFLPALAIRVSQRGPRDWSAFALCLTLVLLTQIRTAALATLILPVAAIAFWWVARPDKARASRRAATLLIAYAVMLCLVPLTQGKKAFQLGTTGDALGFALLPRVGQLQVGPPDAPGLWQQLSSSWQDQALTLDWTEAVLFDGQIQEAIRYDLGPHILFGKGAGSPEEFSWSSDRDRSRARELSLRWIRDQPRDYAVWSIRHATGTLAAATFASQSQRHHVWSAIRAVDSRVWQLATLRDDYPNNHFSEPLKPLTSALYAGVRAFASACAALGLVACAWALFSVLRRSPVALGAGVGAMGFGWLLLHALTVGLTVFPESRFVLLTLWGYVLFGVAAAVLTANQLFDRKSADI